MPEDASQSKPIGRDEVMDAVLAAATDLFSQNGPDGVTVREIADRAGVNHALIHRHFGTKDELLRIVLAQGIERVAAVSARVTNTREDVGPVLSAVLQEETGIRLLAWAILSGYPLETVWPEYPTVDRLRETLGREQAEGGSAATSEDPRVAVASVTALVLGWILFEPFLDRAAHLSELPGYDAEVTLNRLIQDLFDRAR